MSNKNKNLPAHPAEYGITNNGLTKREYAAIAAMQGLLTRVPKRHNGETDLGTLESKRIASEAVIMADLLFQELEKPTTNEQH